MINPNAKLTAEQFLSAQRFFYFMWEALSGIVIIMAMVATSLAIGTILIDSFGDVGGFIWIGITYVAFLGFDPVYRRMVKSMRKYMP